MDGVAVVDGVTSLNVFGVPLRCCVTAGLTGLDYTLVMHDCVFTRLCNCMCVLSLSGVRSGLRMHIGLYNL